MKPRHSLFVQWLAMSLLFGFALFVLYQQDIINYRYKATVPFELDASSLQPAGEITAGFHLAQPVYLSGTDLPRRDLGQHICVGLLMANYKNRRNRGQFMVSFRIEDRHQAVTMEAQEIKDGTKVFVCFDEFKLSDVLQQPALLEIKGIDGRPGRSVTAWLAPASTSETQAALGGQPTDRQLVFSTHVRDDALPYELNAYVLLVLSSMLMAALTLAVFVCGPAIPDNKGIRPALE